MKRPINIFIVAALSLLLSGCGLYNKYEQKGDAPADVFGTTQDIKDAQNGTTLAQLSWREFFTDPVLQQLIDQVLANNTDLNSARIAIEKSEASLQAAKMAYLPSLYLSPQGTLSKFDDYPWSKTYNLPLQMSMDVDLFGSITNKKRAAKAVLLQAQVREEAVRANLVSATAQQYYMLQLLDRQLDILTQTDSLWNASLETQTFLVKCNQIIHIADKGNDYFENKKTTPRENEIISGNSQIGKKNRMSSRRPIFKKQTT